MRARLSLLLAAMVAAVLQWPASASAPAPDGDRGLPLPGVVSGKAAIAALGADAARVAHQYGMSEERLLDLLANDPTVQLDSQGRMRYADRARPAGPDGATQRAAAQFPYSETFKLHSLPGANRVIYLDFNGHNVTGTAWNDEGLPARVYAGLDLDDNAAFSAPEQDVVQDVWQRVAEDFAPFRVDVTTEDPGTAALVRTDSGDNQFGMRALITSDAQAPGYLCGGGCTGIAYVDVFNTTNSAKYQPAFAFIGNDFAPDTAILADTISHEVGHTFSLAHDGKGFAEYYEGQGIWQPIMGAGWPPLSQFSNGDYGGTNPEDDFTVIDGHGGPLRVDDHADTAAGATAIDESAPKTGVISTRADVDWFTVEQACEGPLAIEVETVAPGPNLDVELRVQTSGGSTIATVNPTADFSEEGDGLVGLGAAYSGNQPQGTYRFRVDGVGQGNPTVDGYSDYGSRGSYTVSVFTSCPPPHAPSAPRNLTVHPAANGQSVTVQWDPPRAPGGPITGYTVQRSGGSPVTLPGSASEHTFTGLTPATAYSFSVFATNDSGDGPAAMISGQSAGPASPPTFLSTFALEPGDVALVWSPPDSDGGLPITGYEVQRTGGSPVQLDAETTQHLFTGLTAGVTYTLSVRALTAFGPGAVASVTWVEGAPGQTFPWATALSPTQVKVEWEAPDSGSSPINGYVVGVEGGASVNVTADKRAHTFSGLTPDTFYEFYVQAKNTAGPGPKGTAFATTPPAPRVPGPVAFLSIDETTASTVKFSWQFPADWGLPAELDAFQVRLDSGTWIDKAADPFDPFPSHTFTGLAAGTTYTVSVRAVNATGAGPVESAPFTTTGTTKPGAPKIGTAKSGAAGGTVTAKAVWKPPASNGGSPITNYKVIALKMSSSGAVLSKTTKKVGPSARALTMKLKKAKYRFQVVAINAVGASKPSARSNLVTAR